jgi:hypothetical protein
MGCYDLDSSVSEYGSVAGSCEHGDVPSVFVKYCKIPEEHNDWQLLM